LKNVILEFENQNMPIFQMVNGVILPIKKNEKKNFFKEQKEKQQKNAVILTLSQIFVETKKD